MVRKDKGSKGGGRRRSNRDEGPRKRSRHLEGVQTIDINDFEFLRQFVTEHGKILPARLTGANAGQQRQIRRGIRRARSMGLIM